MLINQGKLGAKSIPKAIDTRGLGHYKDNKVNGRRVVKGHEIHLWTREATSTLLWILPME